MMNSLKTACQAGCVALLLAVSAQAQDLSGAWQGVEFSPPKPGYWPTVVTLKKEAGTGISGQLYQEDGTIPGFTVTFQLRGTQTGGTLEINETRILSQRIVGDGSWCQGRVTFTYNAAEDCLTGQAHYRPDGNCDRGTFTLYRVRLRSPATVKAGALTTLRVSGKNVRWFADPDLKKPLASGNEYRTKLNQPTTFYLVQGYYTTDRSPVVPIAVQPTGAAPPRPLRPLVAAAPPTPALAPVVLPTVLFKITTAELRPESYPALDTLAASLRKRPTLRLRIGGHTDRLGEPDKNQVLSEQRAEAVKDYLVQAGVAAGRLEAVGYGDSRPLYPSPDPRNRRVEVVEVK